MRARRGIIVVLILVMIAILSLVAASQLFIAQSDVAAASAQRQGSQARAAAMSGIHRAMSLLLEMPDDPDARHDNPDVFRHQLVCGQDDKDGWYFTVFCDDLSEGGTIRFGLEDEAGKININIAGKAVLMNLPAVTDAMADCLLDYRGAPGNHPNGAKQDYYDQLPKPYQIKNGPLATLEELLLVKGFTGTVVFGEDANRNGFLEPNENDADASFPPDDADGQLNRGLRCLATAVSYEYNLTNAGQPRVNITKGDANSLKSQLSGRNLPDGLPDFLAAARQQNLAILDPSALLGMKLDVADPKNPNNKTQISSPVTAENLPAVLDQLTTGGFPYNGQEVLFGRVNINVAPKAALMALPGVSEEIAQRIIDLRGQLQPDERTTIAWLYAQNVVSADVFKQVAPLLTARSKQFRLRSYGYSMVSGRFCYLEAIIDIAEGRPRISYLRDLTRLGMPFAPSLAAGQQ
jgi:type II secretory pathway component PulK